MWRNYIRLYSLSLQPCLSIEITCSFFVPACIDFRQSLRFNTARKCRLILMVSNSCHHRVTVPYQSTVTRWWKPVVQVRLCVDCTGHHCLLLYSHIQRFRFKASSKFNLSFSDPKSSWHSGFIELVVQVEWSEEFFLHWLCMFTSLFILGLIFHFFGSSMVTFWRFWTWCRHVLDVLIRY